jgi:hypothetical protein
MMLSCYLAASSTRICSDNPLKLGRLLSISTRQASRLQLYVMALGFSRQQDCLKAEL